MTAVIQPAWLAGWLVLVLMPMYMREAVIDATG